MPILKEYKHDPGYYIRARPPDTGNINYKIKSEAYPIIEGYGLTHKDEITWDMIRSMKSLGFVYTDGSGVLDVGEFEPDPEQLDQTSLSKQQAKELLSTIRNHRDLTSEQLETICTILGIEIPEEDINQLSDLLKEEATSLISEDSIPLDVTLEDPIVSEVVALASTRRLGEDNNKIGIRVLLASFPENSAGEPIRANFVDHAIILSPEDGICDWITGFTREKSWESKSEIIRQMGHLVPVVVGTLNKIGIDPGDPRQSFEPILQEFGDMPF